MGRHRSSKFSFPIPGRKSGSKVDNSGHDLSNIPSFPSLSSVTSASDNPLHYHDSSAISSKAQRLLGTAPPPFRTMPTQSSVPPSPGYMTVTISDTGSNYDDRASSVAAESGRFRLPKRPTLSNRASSNIIPPNVAYTDGESSYASTTRPLHTANSNSTLRSHYDAKSSPLSVSQQTSDSAVRDMALRKGKPQIVQTHHDHVPSPLAQELTGHDKRDYRRSKPPRLDLSKLFPKPRAHGGQEFGGTLLSPNKLVNSPTALSAVSEYFPRPMTREPTPTLKAQAKLTKPQRQQPPPPPRPVVTTSPARRHKPDQYDNAKVNVRRPPQGIQHWFEGLSEDSDEQDEDEHVPIHAPAPVNPSRHYPAVRQTSHNSLRYEYTAPKQHHHHHHHHQQQQQQQQQSRAPQYLEDPRRSQQFHANSSVPHRLNSPSTFSVQSQSSLGTAKTKESAFSRSNLQDSSVLSFSSSEDEGNNSRSRSSRRKVSVRDSIDMSDSGDIVIGQAQAYEVRPRLHTRKPSAGKLSQKSTSTNAATIEVMYTPEPPYTPMSRNSISSRRTSHTRQPSTIHEVDDRRPKTAQNRAQSPSARSTRTSKSEPRSQDEIRKFMAVTPEEEALLEALRNKRAAMARQSVSQGHGSATKAEQVPQPTPPEKSNKTRHRVSGFLAAETPSASPVRVVETKKKPSRKSLEPEPLPSRAPPRGRTTAIRDSSVGSSMFRDSSSCDPMAEREMAAFNRPLSRPLLSPPDFSPLDLFPSPTPTSVASPTTTDHPSPLPSPVTPHMRHGEDDVNVKVASSEPSWNGDTEDVAVFETGVIDPPAGSIKSEEAQTIRQRRRTASSGAELPFPLPMKFQSTEPRNLAPVTEASSRPTSTVEPLDPQPKLTKKAASRNPPLSITTTGLSKSRHNSMISTRTSSPNRSGHPERRSRQVSRAGSLTSMNNIASIKRDSVAVGTASTRCSVSEDVLSAWGSLGGLRDYDTARW